MAGYFENLAFRRGSGEIQEWRADPSVGSAITDRADKTVRRGRYNRPSFIDILKKNMSEETSYWRQVLRFWFGDDLECDWPEPALEERWFGGGAALDREISERFGALVEAALDGGLADWEDDAYARLALIVLLDQFSRNVFRGSARAFTGDARAVALVGDGLASGMDRKLPWAGRAFFYMPLMHAEDRILQARCMTCFEQAAEAAPAVVAEKLRGNLEFARMHAEIIERFGRFPHRNAALGRKNTPAERVYLEHAPRFGQ